MRLIDADKIQFVCAGTTPEELDYVRRYAIDRMPTVDAVPVCRCKDCTFRKWNGFCMISGILNNEDFYCADGKRKGGDE